MKGCDYSPDTLRSKTDKLCVHIGGPGLLEGYLCLGFRGDLTKSLSCFCLSFLPSKKQAEPFFHLDMLNIKQNDLEADFSIQTRVIISNTWIMLNSFQTVEFNRP